MSVKFKVNANIGDGIVSATITLRDFIEAVSNGTLLGYDRNRGNNKLYTTKVKNIALNYDVNKLGVITIADWEDGTYKKADAHHRTAAIMMKFKGENGLKTFTQEELDQNISLHIIKKEDFIRVYTGLNSNNGHSSRQKVLNIDLGLGSLLNSILMLQAKENVVKDSFYTAFARCVYAYIGEFTGVIADMTYADISLDRKLVSSDAGLSKEDFDVKVSKKKKSEIAAALDYVHDVYSEFTKLNNLSTGKKSVKLNATARDILGNAGFFGFLLWDKLSGRNLITGLSAKNLAMRITEKDAQIARQAKEILNSLSRDSAADKIVGYIKTKKRV